MYVALLCISVILSASPRRGVLHKKHARVTSPGSIALPLVLIDEVQLIHSVFGFVYLQLVNEAYTNITLSWACNVKRFHVLEKTVFIATDMVSYQALSAHVPHAILLERKRSLDLSYGQAAYFEFMSFRSKIIEELLYRGINIWLVESDAVWFADPLPYLRDFHDMDVIAGQDGALSDSIPEGGFIFLNATTKTKVMWSDLRRQHERALEDLSGTDNIGDAGSEMLMLPDHLKKVRWAFFPKHRFVSGLWYTNNDMQASSKPVIIQNNWIIGNREKIDRAKAHGHWFLDGSSMACVE